MPRHPRLQKRGSRYFLRVKVPNDLRLAVGKREICKALGTSDPREALKAVRKASAETDAMFELMRGKVIASAATLSPTAPVDLERVIRQEFHEMEVQRVQRFAESDEYDSGEILEILREDEAYLSRELEERTEHSTIRQRISYWKNMDYMSIESLKPIGCLYAKYSVPNWRSSAERSRHIAGTRESQDLTGCLLILI